MAKNKQAKKTRGDLPIFQILNPSKGLNNLIVDTGIDNLESPDLLNIEYTEAGNPGKRQGTLTHGDTVDTKVNGLIAYYKSNGTNKLIRNSGTQMYYDLNGTWTAISGVAFTSTENYNYVVAKDNVYVHNHVDAMAKYNGTTLSQPATGVIAKFGVYYKGYHICAGNPTYPSRLYISNPADASDFTGSSGTASAGGATTLTDASKAWGVNDFASKTVTITAGTGAGQSRTINSNTATILTVGTAWTTNPDATSVYTIASGNWIEVTKDDGDQIKGLGRWQDLCIVCKERSTYQLTFDSTGIPTVAPINNAVGCVSHRSIANVENDLFFLSRQGVYVLGNEPNYLNVIRTNELSARVHPTIEGINPAYLNKCAATYDKYKYMLAIPAGGTTTNNQVLVYDRRYVAWSLWDGITANCWVKWIDSNNAEHLYYGCDDIGKIKEMYQGNADDGVAINAYWYSKNFNLQSFDTYKRWMDITFWFRALYGTVTLSIIVDDIDIIKSATLGNTITSSSGFGTGIFGSRIFALGSGNTGTVYVASNLIKRVKINKKARNIKFKVENNVASESFKLLGFNTMYIPYSHFAFPSADKIQ